MTANILAVDDDEVSLQIIKASIIKMGHTCDTAPSAEDAMKLLEENRYTLIITDEELPGMKGSELVGRVRTLFPDIVCLVVSAHRNTEAVVTALSEHKAMNYLFKPFTADGLVKAVEKACAYADMRTKAAMVTETERRFFEQVTETFSWKQSFQSTHSESVASNMISQITMGFFQGRGIGSLISSLGMLLHSAKPHEDGKHQLIKNSTMDLVNENYEESIAVIHGLNAAQSALSGSVSEFHPVPGVDIYKMIEELRLGLAETAAIKEQEIVLSEIPPSLSRGTVRSDMQKLRSALREILINALKYSAYRSRIYVLAVATDHYLEMRVLNPAEEYISGEIGITGKYEALVFEPFFRLSNVVDERYAMEEFSFGLGLPVVKKIIEQHGGTVFLYTLDDHLHDEPRKDICVNVRLPLSTASGGRAPADTRRPLAARL